VWFRDRPEHDLRQLRQLAVACERFSPRVSVEEAARPESLWLEITGCEPLFGGELPLVTQLLESLQCRGYSPRIGVADTPGAAWALAHTQSTEISRQNGTLQKTLEPLPVTALRLPQSTLSALQALGVQTIRQLLRLPRQELPARLGPEVLQRLDQALGHRPELLVSERRTASLVAEWSQEEPLANLSWLQEVFDHLWAQLLPQLPSGRVGFQSLQWDCLPRSNHPGMVLRCVRPTADARRWRELFQLQCERMSWPPNITGLRLEVLQTGILAEHAPALLAEERDAHEQEVQQLCERLAGRLGEQAVGRLCWQPDPLPELARRFTPLWDQSPQLDHGSSSPLHEYRPGCLLQTPLQIRMRFDGSPPSPVSLEWEDERQGLRRSCGPERIETGWWRGPEVRRDYYRVETTDGRQAWVFQDLKTRLWYVHGWFE